MFKEFLEIEQKNRVLFFLLSILFLLLAFPFFINTELQAFVYTFALTLVLLLGIHVISEERHVRRFGIALGSLAVLMSLARVLFVTDLLFGVAKLVVLFLFFSFTTIVIISEVVKSKEVSPQMIYGAIAGYLLIGLSGAMIFFAIAIMDPNAFNIPVGSDQGMHVFIYYSFVTLATLGYGDVVPTAPYSQIFAVMLSILGQFYLTILVAMLVGKYISQQRR